MMTRRKFSEASIRVVSFISSRKDYLVWVFKFLAKAGSLGFKKILLGTVVIASETEYAAALILDEASRTTHHTKTIENY